MRSKIDIVGYLKYFTKKIGRNQESLGTGLLRAKKKITNRWYRFSV